MRLTVFYYMILVLFSTILFASHKCCASQLLEQGETYVNATLDASDGNSFSDYGEQQQRRRKRMLMNIPALTFDYFWKTFVVRFFISQNMKNFDVTTWPKLLMHNYKGHMANEPKGHMANVLRALMKTLFLRPTKEEMAKSAFKIDVIKSAIVNMSDRLGTYLALEYPKHVVNLEIKEQIEPSFRYVRSEKPKDLRTFLQQFFLVGLDNRGIPMLREEGEKQDFKELLIDRLENENLLLFMKDLRMLEKEKPLKITDGAEGEQDPLKDANANDNNVGGDHAPPEPIMDHQKQEEIQGEEEMKDEWLWWEESDGETNYGFISRLFGDLSSADGKLLERHGGEFTIDKDVTKHYLYGIKFVFEHLVELENAKLKELFLPSDGASTSEITEVMPVEKIYILNQLRRATCVIFMDSLRRIGNPKYPKHAQTTHDASELLELNKLFFPKRDEVKKKLIALEKRINSAHNALLILTGGKDYDAEEENNDDNNANNNDNGNNNNNNGQSPAVGDIKKTKKKSFNPIISLWKRIKKPNEVKGGGTAQNVEVEVEKLTNKKKAKVPASEPKKDDNSTQQQIIDLKHELDETVYEFVDMARYILSRNKEWLDEMKRCHLLLCEQPDKLPDKEVKDRKKFVGTKLLNRIDGKNGKVCSAIVKWLKDHEKPKNGDKKLQKIVGDARKTFGKISTKAKGEAFALFSSSPPNTELEEIFRKNCQELIKLIEVDEEKLRNANLKALGTLHFAKTESEKKAEIERVMKREILLNPINFRLILERYFVVETNGFLKIKPDLKKESSDASGKAESEIVKDSVHGSSRRDRRAAELLIAFALVEPIIETTILQQIFRQWNFYKWFIGCVRRTYRYTSQTQLELRCKEPAVLAEEKRFIGMVTTTVFEELTKEGVNAICGLYQEFIKKEMFKYNQVTVIKYPSTYLKEIGLKLGVITKELMDTAWRSMNALGLLHTKLPAELRKMFHQLLDDLKKQRVEADEVWPKMGEFVTLTVKRQHASASIVCRENDKNDNNNNNNNDNNGENCLRAEMKELRRKMHENIGTLQSVLPKKRRAIEKIVDFFEWLFEDRVEQFRKLLDAVLSHSEEKVPRLELLIALFTVTDRQFLREVVTRYAQGYNSMRTFITKQFRNAISREENKANKYVYELLRERLEFAAEGAANVGEVQTPITELFKNCNEFAKLDVNVPENVGEASTIFGKIGAQIRQLLIMFDAHEKKQIAPQFSHICADFIHYTQELIGESKAVKKRENPIKSLLKMSKPPSENELEAIKEMEVLLQLLAASGLQSEDSEFKYAATRLREATKETKFEELRVLLVVHLGKDMSTILQHYAHDEPAEVKGNKARGIRLADQETGFWKHRGDFENNEFKQTFGKIYTKIIKQFATNLETIEQVERENLQLNELENRTSEASSLATDEEISKGKKPMLGQGGPSAKSFPLPFPLPRAVGSSSSSSPAFPAQQFLLEQSPPNIPPQFHESEIVEEENVLLDDGIGMMAASALAQQNGEENEENESFRSAVSLLSVHEFSGGEEEENIAKNDL